MSSQMILCDAVSQPMYLSFINEAEQSCDVIKREDNSKIFTTSLQITGFQPKSH